MNRLTRRFAALAPAAGTLAALCWLGSTAGAHDEDWRKIADRQKPVFADPIVGDYRPRGNGGFDAMNMSLLAWLPLNAFPGSQPSGNDCWGFVSGSGREYIIMGLENGTAFVEVTDPINPVIVQYLSGPNSFWRDIKVIGDYAYAVSEGGSGVQVFDISNADSGVITHVRNVMRSGHTTTHNIVANEDSGYLYLCGANIANGGLVAMDTNATPDNPTIAGAWSSAYVHDAQVVTYTQGPYAGKEIAFCFADGSGQTGLRIVDVTNKSSMVTIGSVTWPGMQYSHQGWLSEDRQYVYIDDELDEGATVSVTTTRVVNVSDPGNPFLVGTFTSGSTSIDHNLYTHNGYIFEANYRSGLRVFDASNPTNPTQVAYFDTYPNSDSASFNGAWSNYPYLPSGTIAISDIERGLFLVSLGLQRIDFTLTSAPTLLSPSSPNTIVVDLTLEGTAATDVTLHALADGQEQTIAMSPVDADTYSATLPSYDCLTPVTYWVSAVADSGATQQSDTVYAIVATGTAVRFEDDMQTNTGWTVGAAGDNATTGIWNRMAPQATDAQPGADHSPSGTLCWVTDGNAGGSVGANDVDGGKTTLVSPAIDLSGADAATASYWRWYSNSAGSNPFSDTFRVEITSNGTTWVNVETVGPGGAEASGGWYYHEFSVTDFVPLSANVRLRFIAEDADPGSIVEAAIDDVLISAIECEVTACAADFDSDGDADGIDIGLFLQAYSSQSLAADMNGDGILNGIDVGLFLSAYAAGCQ